MKEEGNERGDAINEQAAGLSGDGRRPKFRKTGRQTKEGKRKEGKKGKGKQRREKEKGEKEEERLPTEK